MRSALAVRLDTGGGGGESRMVTRFASDLSFSKTAPGGHRTMSCTINTPLDSFPRLGPSDKIYVMDGATGATVFEGYTDVPGRRDDAAGETFTLTAQGVGILASDRADRLIYRDTSPDSWTTDNVTGKIPGSLGANGSSKNAQAGVDTFPTDAGTRAGDPALMLAFPKGSDVVNGESVAIMRYRQFADSPMALGAIRFFRDAGADSSNYIAAVVLQRLSTGAGPHIVYSDGLVATGGTVTYISPDNLIDYEAFASLRPTATFTVGSSNAWFGIGELGVLGKPMDRHGVAYDNLRTSGFYAYEVAEDVFGRLLGDLIDTAALAIDESDYLIDALTFLEPATPANVLDELLKFQDFDWGIGESNPAGRHKAWFRKWPTTPQLVLGDDVPLDLPGAEDTLVNRVAVEWTSQKGRPHVTVVGTYVPELGNRNPVDSDGKIDPGFTGRIKDADKVTLPEGRGSYANAAQAGARALAEKNRIAYSGTAVITEPMLDLVKQRYLMPWELEPGVVARQMSLGLDLRVTEVQYNDNDGATTLTLNTPVPSLERYLTRLRRLR